MTFKVPHIAPDLRKHQQLVQAVSTAQAQAWMEQLYGVALVLSTICLGGRP